MQKLALAAAVAIIVYLLVVGLVDAQAATARFRCEERVGNNWIVRWDKVGGGQCPVAVTATPTASPTPPPTPSPSPSPTPRPTPSPTPTATPPPVVMARVTTSCESEPVYMRYQVDPIVSPGSALSAHVHAFYGRRDISGSMFAVPRPAVAPEGDAAQRADPGYTPISNSCSNYGDWAAYWFPASLWNGVIIDVPWYTSIGTMWETWQTPAGVPAAKPPFGMAYVVGDAHATTQQPHVRFTCGPIDGPGFALPQPCATGNVTTELTFPDCFNGQDALGSIPAGINPAFFSYSVGGACPAGSGRIAQLVTRQQFIDPRTGTTMTNPRNADGTIGLSFSSGGPLTYHGDFMNTWAQLALLGNCILSGHDECAVAPVGP